LNLKDLIEMFLLDKGLILLQHFIYPYTVISLAHLTDKFGIQNSLDVSLQGKEITILEADKMVQTFQEKKSVKSAEFANFSSCNQIISDSTHPAENSHLNNYYKWLST
jgi:hypothetical protein